MIFQHFSTLSLAWWLTMHCCNMRDKSLNERLIQYLSKLNPIKNFQNVPFYNSSPKMKSRQFWKSFYFYATHLRESHISNWRYMCYDGILESPPIISTLRNKFWGLREQFREIIWLTIVSWFEMLWFDQHAKFSF